MKKLLITLAFAFIISAVQAEDSRLFVVYEDDVSKDQLGHIARLKEENALPDMVQFINETVPFVAPVTLRIGAEDGPLFDPQINEIWVPIEFLSEIDDRFVQSELATNKEERDNAVQDVLLHTLLHEIAHTIIAQFEIPTLGKEEDAADNLANVLLLEYFDDGDLMALNAADMFALEDQDSDTFEQSHFWDEHSLDIQRYYTTLCHVYGARPDDNEALIENDELSEERAERCIDEYAQVRADWLFVLEGLDGE